MNSFDVFLRIPSNSKEMRIRFARFSDRRKRFAIDAADDSIGLNDSVFPNIKHKQVNIGRGSSELQTLRVRIELRILCGNERVCVEYGWICDKKNGFNKHIAE